MGLWGVVCTLGVTGTGGSTWRSSSRSIRYNRTKVLKESTPTATPAASSGSHLVGSLRRNTALGREEHVDDMNLGQITAARHARRTTEHMLSDQVGRSTREQHTHHAPRLL
eukprot:1293431-Pyramimonas_sp.AAC.3